MEKIGSIEEYIEKHENYSEALIELRKIINSTELEETIKWNIPTYTINNKNVIGIGAFKHHFGIWFFNGVFLKDDEKLLRNAQDGKTKAMRQMIFKSIDDINKNLVLKYVKEAIENQKAGKVIKADRTKKKTVIPTELDTEFKKDSDLKKAFEGLSPYKQREYCDHISSAKREATKISRLEKIKPMILNGAGLHDKYKNC
ncbi:MAG: YdeI/OmpD-associated family protein [Bacteroidia bacterium]|nr:YdeI/OmpD-associated family protein [Bacteroidia bacterium]NND24579.1 hypothetical protein [Flavobacteriaceae bacterium]MBT8278248.1 YdeI/OmpD-associated family protein [Bacteroidia bacterium]NNK59088.1 hypothetical protein [Flavobacteriaceae bacterium]NNL31680.1 hypothetical protein [Flavobacteriaceae bacterium]